MFRKLTSNTAVRLVVNLAINLLIVYALYMVCRVLFVGANIGLFPDLTWGHVWALSRAGLVFDSSAIFYTNALIILMFLVPVPPKERPVYYTIVHWVYVLVNAVCITANLVDIAYFPFTGKRSTMAIFSEFGNEGAANMTNIVWHTVLANWWLILVSVPLFAALWFGFQGYPKGTVKDTSSRRRAWYYTILSVALIAMAYLSVGMMRGGFTHAVRPITISNANQYTDSPAEAGVVLNTPFSLIRTIGHKPLRVPDYMPQDVADTYFSPVHIPADTVRFTPHNVVVLIVESFSKQHIGYYNIEQDENGSSGFKRSFTPFVDSLLNSGKALTYRYSYANGRKSIEGMPSVLSSIPNFVEPFFLTPASLNDLTGLAGELTDNKGYSSAFFHGAENGSMGFEAFARSTGFQRYYGRTEYNSDPRFGGDKDFDDTWAIWDEEFLQFFALQLDELPQPFVASVFTATSHTPFKLPKRYEGKFPQGPSPLQQCIAYTDNALRLFFETAKQQPWYDNTIFVITADHTSQPVDPFYSSLTGHYAVPIIFYAPGLKIPTGYDANTIAEQTDIMPTVLSLLGYDRPYIAFGKDLTTTPPARSFALHWVPENDTYEYIAPHLVLRFDGRDITSAYDLDTDPLQRRDILPSISDSLIAPHDTIIRALIQQYMLSLTTNTMRVKSEE